MSRAERVRQVEQLAVLLGRKPLQREIAAELGVSLSYAASLTNDPSGDADRERKKRYAGVCAKCGGPTSGGDGRAKAPKHCLSCFNGDAVHHERVRETYPIWDEQKCLDSIVRWVERNERLPTTSDLIHCEPGERPALGTIIKYCYRYEPRESMEWRGGYEGEGSRRKWVMRERLVTRTWTTRNLHDILVELAPRFPSSVVILTARNLTLRSRLFEVVGIEEIIRLSGEKVCSDEFGTLWRITSPPTRVDRGPGEAYMVVQVVNSTPEPDGGFRDYFLRVPPDVATPREAIAWTFAVEADDYVLAEQT